AEDGIRDDLVTGVQTCALPISYVGSGDGWIYCLEAATGKTQWRFRAAPVERTMPVYGSLSSTWPVGSGVLVEGGVAFAAAGIFRSEERRVGKGCRARGAAGH